MVANRHALSHRARRAGARHQEARFLAHFPAHLHEPLHTNGEDVKVVQELLRHGSAKVTLNVYVQAQMPAKRNAQHNAVEMVRPEARQVALAMAT